MNSSPAVFIDWFGTIADREMAPRRYAEVMGHVLHTWWGGPVEAGIAAHNTAFARELQEWPRRLQSAASYRTALRQSQADYIRILANAYGRPFQGSDEEAVILNERLFSTVAAQVDVTYPDVQPALRRLKQLGCRIFPASGAPAHDLKGLITASRLESYFDEIISCEMLDADKNTPAFWHAALRHTHSSARASWAVDDTLRPLGAAQEAGCSCVIVDRSTVTADAPFPRIATLAPLPDLVMTGA